MNTKPYYNYLNHIKAGNLFLQQSWECLSNYGMDENDYYKIVKHFFKFGGDCMDTEKVIFKIAQKCGRYLKNSGIWPDKEEKISKNIPLIFFFRWMVSTYVQNKKDGERFRYLKSELSKYGERDSKLCSPSDAIVLYRELFYYYKYGNEPIQKRPVYSDYCNFTVIPVEHTMAGEKLRFREKFGAAIQIDHNNDNNLKYTPNSGSFCLDLAVTMLATSLEYLPEMIQFTSTCTLKQESDLTIYLMLWNSYFQACMGTYYKENECEIGGNER